jgi:hypothetical protein
MTVVTALFIHRRGAINGHRRGQSLAAVAASSSATIAVPFSAAIVASSATVVVLTRGLFLDKGLWILSLPMPSWSGFLCSVASTTDLLGLPLFD